MASGGGGGGGGAEAAAVRTSDRLRLRPKMYGRAYLHHYYSPSASIIHRNRNRNRARKRKAGAKGTKTRNRTAASHIADKFLSNKTEDGGDSNLRRSTRKRKAVHLEDYTDSTGCEEEDEDNDIMRPSFHRLRKDDLPLKSNPRRAGLRPRRSKGGGQVVLEDDEEEDEDEDEDGEQQQLGKDEDELRKEEGEEVEEEEEEEEEDVEEEEEEEEEEDVEEEEEEEGRRRYDLRNRADVVRRMSMMDEGKPRRHQVRKSGSGPKRHHHPHHHRMTRAALDDSDDSLLVDEPAAPWVGRRPWLLDASGWGESTSAAGVAAASAVVHTSSKGGADIQPVQVGEEVSFDDVGGLSEHIEALKEMVFFPLLYPEFFASYHITPPRGVLLCGPPGTGKTLMARALACSASKAGRKVSFYMRKGADVLSKWVGEAERQLKMLFEEAQRNQPSIIFFDEIDGLAPVRSSKQEQIHNSIVSTLLALMDGLDSRGQVVLIGATNRVDAIDGALRRPGRFDREFTFPLPNAPARAHILDIHTRRWRVPPSPDLRHELAAACVGYCGADLKALCTEAAIRAFRQRYPQVYASDDKFLIDADSITVNRAHFLQAMSAITPAAHRGSLVLSRPLPPVVAPCLRPHLLKAMDHISDVFPDLTYRPRLLLCASPASGLDHIAPAILHELEKFPVHSIGLSSLISDPSAKTPEEALVHIFAEARRTTPSVLYLPHFHLWWDTAHDQLKAVLLTLLEELPSDLPILLLGTSSVPLHQLYSDAVSIFSNRSVYQVGDLTEEDRGLFFDHLIQSALSVLLEGMANKSPEPSSSSVPELQKAPTVESGPKISELKAKVEAEQHALRRLRMCLRDICNRILYDKRFTAFHFPVSDEDAPNYRSIIQNPMDMASLLQRVDSGQYITCSAFVEDIDLIVSNAKVYNGDDYNGSRIVSRAYELRDTVHGMLSQMDPGLVAYCDKIQEEGGPMQLPEELGVSTFPLTPVVQLGTSITRASARVRNVQPDINVDKSNEALKRPKKSVDDEKSQPPESPVPEMSGADHDQPETCVSDASEPTDDDVTVQNQVESIKRLLVERSLGFCIPQLERLYTRIIKAIFQAKDTQLTKASILRILLDYAQDDSNFAL